MMMPRPRKPENRGLPPNLHCKDGRYVWRDPRSLKDYPLGRDRADAINQAVEANHAVLSSAKATLLDRLTGDDTKTVAAFCAEYLTRHPGADLQEFMRVGKSPRSGYWGLGEVILKRLTPDQYGAWVDQWKDKPYARAKVIRSSKAVLSEASKIGKIGPINPAALYHVGILRPKRQRLDGIEDFLAIREKADPILQLAMNLALVTGQRQGDICKMERGDIKDGFLHVEQQKSRDNPRPSKLRLDVNLGLKVAGLTIASAIAACRGNVLTRNILHYRTKWEQRKPGDRVLPSYLQEAFRQARAAAGYPEKHGPTFHEIRSLAGRLYRSEGYDPQSILGHKDPKQTAEYLDPRTEWTTVICR